MTEENKIEETQQSQEIREESKKKLSPVAIVVIIAGVLVIALLAVFLFANNSQTNEEEKIEMPKEAIFFDIPEIIVSLSGNTTNIRYLKLVIALELEDEQAKAVVDSQMPKIIDEYQIFLRQLRLEDLRGSIGSYRLKEALLLRASQVVQPVKVNDVLIKEMLIQ